MAEARGLRERVLSDLNERRGDLERQIGELRAGRGRLVEVYELVERATLAGDAHDGRGTVDAGGCRTRGGRNTNAGRRGRRRDAACRGWWRRGVTSRCIAECRIRDCRITDRRARRSARSSRNCGREPAPSTNPVRKPANRKRTPPPRPQRASRRSKPSRPWRMARAPMRPREFAEGDDLIVDEPAAELLDDDHVALAKRAEALAPIADDLAHPGETCRPGRAERRPRRPSPSARKDRPREGPADHR